jgi:hypothetical protein
MYRRTLCLVEGVAWFFAVLLAAVPSGVASGQQTAGIDTILDTLRGLAFDEFVRPLLKDHHDADPTGVAVEAFEGLADDGAVRRVFATTHGVTGGRRGDQQVAGPDRSVLGGNLGRDDTHYRQGDVSLWGARPNNFYTLHESASTVSSQAAIISPSRSFHPLVDLPVLLQPPKLQGMISSRALYQTLQELLGLAPNGLVSQNLERMILPADRADAAPMFKNRASGLTKRRCGTDNARSSVGPDGRSEREYSFYKVVHNG